MIAQNKSNQKNSALPCKLAWEGNVSLYKRIYPKTHAKIASGSLISAFNLSQMLR